LDKRSIRCANTLFMICVWGLLLGSLFLSVLYAYLPAISGYILQLSALVMLLSTLLPIVIALGRPCGHVFSPAFNLKSVDLSIILIIPMALGGFYFFTGMNGLFQMLAEKLKLSFLIRSNVEAIVSPQTSGFVLIMLGAIFPGIIEESLFRGVLLPAYAHKGKWKAIIITSALFAVLHGQPVAAPTQFAIGLLLGYIFTESGSVFPCMLYHALHNGISLWLYQASVSMVDTSDELTALAEELLSSPGALLISLLLYIAVGGAILFGSLAAYKNFRSMRVKARRLSIPLHTPSVYGEAKLAYLPMWIGIAGIVLYNILALTGM
jgi:membrane protease YdiL (CAAX protease family)